MKPNLMPSISRKASAAITLASLIAAATANANLSFTIDEFTSDLLTVTISGTLSGDTPEQNGWALFLADTSGTSSFIESTETITVDFDSSIAIGSTAIYSAETMDLIGNITPAFVFYDYLTAGDSLTNSATFTFESDGAFDPDSVTELGLYWGTSIDSTPTGGTLQQTVDLSAVPELSSFSLLLGLFTLGASIAGTRRRAK
jgi:hypothetical protein